MPLLFVQMKRPIDLREKRRGIRFRPVIDEYSVIRIKIVDQIGADVIVVIDRSLQFFFDKKLDRCIIRCLQSESPGVAAAAQ